MRSPNEYEIKIAEAIYDSIECGESSFDLEIEVGSIKADVICSSSVWGSYEPETNYTYIYCDRFSIDDIKITEYNEGNIVETKAEVRSDIIEVLVTDMFDTPIRMKRRRRA